MNAFDRARRTLAWQAAERIPTPTPEEATVAEKTFDLTNPYLAGLAERVRDTKRAYEARPTSEHRRSRYAEVTRAFRDALVDTAGLTRSSVLHDVVPIAEGETTVAAVNEAYADQQQDEAEQIDVLVTRTPGNPVSDYAVVVDGVSGPYLTTGEAVTLMQHLADALGFDLRKKD